MATLAPPPSRSPSPARMPRKWARRCEQACCIAVSYFPLTFVFSLTTWAVWVETHIGFYASGDTWWGDFSAILGIGAYLLMSWSYLTAVFTSPGYTVGRHGYSTLPSHASPAGTNLTVKSNGETRYCKKCQSRKPDRAHHCSTCKTCVLKMDHHCPWLSNCVGLHNYKAFLLFLIYTTLFCIIDFVVAAGWVYREIVEESEYGESLMPINYIMLAVIAGIIGLVLGGFAGWHISLAAHGQTTIECLEKTRYLSPLRKQTPHPRTPRTPRVPVNGDLHKRSTSRERDGDDLDLPGTDVRYHQSYEALERQRAQERYQAYLEEQDEEKLPSAFDLGAKRNLHNLFGPSKLLWFLPICNSIGDGWNWEPSPKWLAARDQITSEREQQRMREVAAGWGPGDASPELQFAPADGAGRHYVDAYPSRSKADKILGRDPDSYTDEPGLSMQDLVPRRGSDDFYDSSDGESEAERKALDQKAAQGLTRKVGVMTNTILGNTVARQKDDVRGWDGQDVGID